MGMFDYVKCEYLLPLPENTGEAKDINFNVLSYQTKDLENSLYLYTIKNDGTLWVTNHEFEYDKPNPKSDNLEEKYGKTRLVREWQEQLLYTGSISFYDLLTNDKWKNNYWIEFVATFVDGKLIDIKLLKFAKNDDTKRVQTIQELNNKLNNHEVLWNKWYIKYLYAYYDKTMANVFKFYRHLKCKMPTSYEVERWFRPF
jgi:hypothetical protein